MNSWEYIFYKNISSYLGIINAHLANDNQLRPLSDEVKLLGGYAFKSSSYQNEGVPVIRISDFQNEKIVLNNVKFYKENDNLKRYELHEGDIIIALTGGTIGKLAVVQPNLGKLYLNQRVAKFEVNDKNRFIPEYVYWVARGIESNIKSIAWGGAQPNVSTKQIESLEFAIPDKDTQQKIIDFLNNLKKTIPTKEYFNKDAELRIISMQESSYKIFKLLNENKNQTTILTKLRQSILQEAIEGKLTADWRKENPVRKGDPDYDAEALLEKIKGEKEKLIKEGKIKKQNPLSPIKPEEVPFELPEGWVWTRLGEVAYKITDGTHFTPHYTKTGVQFVSAKDIKSGELIFNNCKFISKEQHEKLFERCNPEEFDIIISKSGSIGTVVLNKYKHHFSFFESLALVKYFSKVIIPSYMQLCVQFSCNNLKREDIRGVAVKHLHLEVLRTLLTAIPPITEQQVIANRVEKFLLMVDELEKQVLDRKELSEQLMQAVLREAFEEGK